MENLSIADPAPKLHLRDARAYLKSSGFQWDLIYLDPPFPLSGKLKFLELISQNNLLAPLGRMVMHYPGEETYPDAVGRYQKTDHRTYGRSHLIFYSNLS